MFKAKLLYIISTNKIVSIVISCIYSNQTLIKLGNNVTSTKLILNIWTRFWGQFSLVFSLSINHTMTRFAFSSLWSISVVAVMETYLQQQALGWESGSTHNLSFFWFGINKVTCSPNIDYDILYKYRVKVTNYRIFSKFWGGWK